MLWVCIMSVSRLVSPEKLISQARVHYVWQQSYCYIYIIQIYSGITRGRVLSGELYTQRLQKVNLSVFVYRVFHENFIRTR